jgi:hypothetical protein
VSEHSDLRRLLNETGRLAELLVANVPAGVDATTLSRLRTELRQLQGEVGNEPPRDEASDEVASRRRIEIRDELQAFADSL